MVDDKELVLETFSRYHESFSAFEPEAMAAFCELPCILFGASGFVRLATPNDAVQVFRQIMERLRTRGYGYSGLSQLQAKVSNGGMALIKGTEIRFTCSGQELNRFELNYVLRRNGDAWRIVTGTVHEADLIQPPA